MVIPLVEQHYSGEFSHFMKHHYKVDRRNFLLKISFTEIVRNNEVIICTAQILENHLGKEKGSLDMDARRFQLSEVVEGVRSEMVEEVVGGGIRDGGGGAMAEEVVEWVGSEMVEEVVGGAWRVEVVEWVGSEMWRRWWVGSAMAEEVVEWVGSEMVEEVMLEGVGGFRDGGGGGGWVGSEMVDEVVERVGSEMVEEVVGGISDGGGGGGVDVTLMVIDGCHHTQKGEVYNNIMMRYLKQRPAPEGGEGAAILGLTASPGVGRATISAKAEEHILRDPFGDVIKNIMSAIHGHADLHLACDFGTQNYEQSYLPPLRFLTAAKREDQKVRVWAKHLRRYNEGQQLSSVIRMCYALDEAERKKMEAPEEEAEPIQTTPTERFLVNLFDDKKQKLQSLAKDENNTLRTRHSAIALTQWVQGNSKFEDIHAQGRARAKDSSYTLVDVLALINTYQFEAIQEWMVMRMKRRNKQMKSDSPSEVSFSCRGCNKFLCTREDIEVIDQMHHVVVSTAFPYGAESEPRGDKRKKISCTRWCELAVNFTAFELSAHGSLMAHTWDEED
ncbi:LOW QUALITY PROTEIN: hypothetical protein CRUP_018796 [Coryphaenoides rupestris]|nr:LOW QUALITY PROTEIN: hypothetical protein CRUP_018796 [Coryphaenoides rupestris]